MSKISMCHIRILHAVPNSDPFHIFTNGCLLQTAFQYKEFTRYYHAIPGIYHFSVFQANHPKNLLFSQNFVFDSSNIYTVAFIGAGEKCYAEVIPDIPKQINPSKSAIRLINLSPSPLAFDVFFDQSKLIQQFVYREISPYFSMSPRTGRLTIKNHWTGEQVIVHPSLKLEAGKAYSGIIVGLENETPKLEILLPLEGKSYLSK